MTRTSRYTYQQNSRDALTATDLQTEAAEYAGPVEAYVITFYDENGYEQSTGAEALYLPAEGRLGIAWGADASWADVADLESGIRMWATDGTAWEAAN